MTEPLITVRLLGVPTANAVGARQHFEELSREFFLLAESDESVRHDVPGRLLQLSDDLRRRFGAFSSDNDALLDDAAERGEPTIDLTLAIPRDAGQAAVDLEAMLDEVDAYCSAGDYLLTLRTPPAVLTYRRWYLRQIIDQIDGAAPIPFTEWTAAGNS